MHLELRAGVAKSDQCRDGRQFAGFKVDAGAAVYVAEAELDNVAAKVRRDVGERCDNRLSGFPIDLRQSSLATFKS